MPSPEEVERTRERAARELKEVGENLPEDVRGVEGADVREVERKRSDATKR